MKKTKTIQLEIHSESVAEFYFALYCYKTSNKFDVAPLKMMVDAIHFDNDAMMLPADPSELQAKKINDKILSIHNYLLKSKKDSEDYFKVSKENIEKFKASSFIKELYYTFKMLELSKKYIGLEESTEVNAGMAAQAYASYNFSNSKDSSNKEKKQKSKKNLKIQTKDYITEMGDFALKQYLNHKSISKLLRIPINKREEIEARDWIVLGIYDLLKEHYPDITLHVSTTITGYICSTIEILDSEEQHDNSDRKQPYRKYLKDSIYNILKNHSRILK